MKLIRILGKVKDGGEFAGIKTVILCGVDESNHLVDGDWFGYTRDDEDGMEYPFVLRCGKRMEFGGPNKLIFRTNIATKALRVGEYFTMSGEHDGLQGWENACLVTHLTPILIESSATQQRALDDEHPDPPGPEPRPRVAVVQKPKSVKNTQATQEMTTDKKAHIAKIAATDARKAKVGSKKSTIRSKKK